jgi:replicative DNA helicase
MVVQLASQIVLSETDAEWTLLGSLFDALDRFGELATDMNPAWFSDSLARYMFVECKKLIDEGHTLSMPVVISLLPEDIAGTPRSRFYANARLGAVPADQLGGLIATLKDRWARRELIAAADAMKASAPLFGQDPYSIASETVLALDTINAAKADKRTGTLATATEALFEHIRQPSGTKGAPTGLKAIDRRLNGYVRGQLYVFAGRPGMGKSAFVCSSLWRTAAAGYGVGIFSLEMTEEEIAARIIADRMDDRKAPTYGDILRGLMGDAEWERAGEAGFGLKDIPLHIDASPRLTFSEIAGRARQFKAKLEANGHFLSVLCIDHMGLVTPSDRYRGNKVAEAGEVSGMARALAKELDCCVILLCQLSRDVEKRDDKKPTMSDLRWSGEIEQDAHVVAFLYRPAYYLAQDPNADAYAIQDARWSLDFLIRKNRNGETADVPLWCSIAHSSVRDAD